MTRIRENTKKYADFMREYQMYLKAEFDDIYDAYARPSTAKTRSYYSWLDWIYEHFDVSKAVKILGHNCMQYTLGFEYTDENGVVCFAKVTRDNIYWAEV